MAKRQRNYQREYEQRKARAAKIGLKSERELKRMQRANREWSATHSQQDNTKYPHNPSLEVQDAYNMAFVTRLAGGSVAKRERAKYNKMKRYMVKVAGKMTAAEFDAQYASMLDKR